VLPSEDFEHLPFERMTSAYDGHLVGVSVEVVVMGIVSCRLSTEFHTRG